MDAVAEERGRQSPPHAPAYVRRGRAALAGLLGAAAALVTIELIALSDATGTSVTESVQNRFIDTFAGSLKDFAVSMFGRNDKAALQVGTAVVVLLLGALVGAAAGPRWKLVAASFGAFAALGIAVALGDPLASGPVSMVAAVLGALVGTLVTVGLERRWRLAVPAGRGTASGQAVPSRRAVLTGAGATAVALLVGASVARAARASMRRAATTVSRALPRPVRKVPAPTSQPFSEERLSSYITPTADFYRIDTAIRVPVVDPSSWRLKITGQVAKELTFTYDDLMARPLVEVPITIQCVSNEVGGDLIGTARWTGVPLASLLREAGVNDGADQIVGQSVDGFTAGFPTSVALDGRDALVVLGMNGRSLPAAHGFPARLLVPGLYGYVSATKWLEEIRLTTFANEQGYWVPLGWSRLGPIKTQSRIDVPSNGDAVPAGRRAIAGVAWAPHRGIARVEISVDKGPWQEAQLGRVASNDTWVQWHLRWDAEPGDHTVSVRATDRHGDVQTAKEAPPDPDGATGHHTILVSVA